MQLYDGIIAELNALLAEYSGSAKELENQTTWNDVGKHNMILRSDMAFELGGSETQLCAVGGTAVTSDSELVPCDKILLIGDDLSEIKGERPYARISICRVNSETMGEGNSLYTAIKNIEYVRYHVSPEGFMVRVSSIQNRESARVSREAVKKGISFSDVGCLMLNSLHKNPNVIAAKVVFITKSDFDFERLERLLKKSEGITKTIDHIMSDSSIMDCHACNLQEICNEVEGMRELHFKKNSENT